MPANTINQITTANTFQQWLTTTSLLIATANLITNGNGQTFYANTILEVSGTGARLNVNTSGFIETFYSNTANLLTANVGSLVGTANTAIYDKIAAVEASSLAFSIALG